MTIRNGIYQHYKGPKYEVYGTAQHSETEQELVIYRALYGEYGLWVRPAEMFTELVDVDGEQRPRFKLIEEKASPLG